MSGFVLVDKPAGLTCARVVERVKRVMPAGTRVGHAGALDSAATGLVILLVGDARRRCEEVMGMAKRYEAEVRLGATTVSDDGETEARAVEVGRFPTREEIEAVLARMIGTVMQRPPVYSALKVRGKRASDRARAGAAVELAARAVRIDAIEVTGYAWPTVALRIDCGRGTYVRAIARDLGAALGVGGYVAKLRRTRIGAFEVRDAQALVEIAEGREKPRIVTGITSGENLDRELVNR